MRVRIQLWPLLLTAILSTAYNAPACDIYEIRPFKIEGFAQGTSYHITYYATDSLIEKKTIEGIISELDSSLSIYKPYSLINKFNNSDTGVEMDQHLSKVVRRSIEIYRETKGISDISIYPVVDAWGFGISKVSRIPTAEVIKKIMPCVGLKKIHINGTRLLKDIPCLKIDVNGIAQGYSVDVLANFIESKGIQNYIVELGGEIRARGRKQPGGEFMQIGIEQPSDNDDTSEPLQKIIKLENGAITTSGNYRKYISSGNKKFSHLMDPKTGYPIDNELISITVRASDAMSADGYDNALMGMGLKKALRFVRKHKELEAYFIFHKPDGTVTDTASAGFYKANLQY